MTRKKEDKRQHIYDNLTLVLAGCIVAVIGVVCGVISIFSR